MLKKKIISHLNLSKAHNITKSKLFCKRLLFSADDKIFSCDTSQQWRLLDGQHDTTILKLTHHVFSFICLKLETLFVLLYFSVNLLDFIMIEISPVPSYISMI